MSMTYQASRTTPHLSLTLGARPSQLARWQTEYVIRQLRTVWPALEFRTLTFTTTGDKTLDRPLPEIGGKGVFTEELEQALRSGAIDLAVHSLKDLPIDSPPDLILGAISARADARDVLIARDGSPLDQLPHGARIGTSSLRRGAQLLAARSDLVLLPLRGNVDTRVRKALRGEYAAIVLAAAGVLRLGLDAHITQYLPFDVMLPAPGQGALAVQCRADDSATRELLMSIDDAATRAAVTAERAFLNALGGGCSAPVAAYAHSNLQMTGLAAAPDGRRVIRVSGEGADPVALGAQLAQRALAQGAQELLR
ncbi:MAG TPA: hydroxymethylbilane synthase [Anaerolineae bacterium]|nr:hydroxymethylbilane synthase [Anaerolineae bacterium]